MSTAHWLSALVLGSAYVLASTVGAAAEVDQGDAAFMQKAALSSLMEIEASQIAQKSADSENIKAYADQMIRDHTAVSKLQNELALEKDILLPMTLGPQEQTRLEQLQAMQGEAFDLAYIRQFGVAAHEEAVTLFQNAARGAADVDIKAFAAQTLPALRAHLHMAETLQDQLPRDGQ